MEFLPGHCLPFLHSEYALHKTNEGNPKGFEHSSSSGRRVSYLYIYLSNLSISISSLRALIAMTFNVATNMFIKHPLRACETAKNGKKKRDLLAITPDLYSKFLIIKS